MVFEESVCLCSSPKERHDNFLAGFGVILCNLFPLGIDLFYVVGHFGASTARAGKFHNL
jgi:hypothetical protein